MYFKSYMCYTHPPYSYYLKNEFDIMPILHCQMFVCLRYSEIGYQFVNSYGKKSRTHFLEPQVKNDVECLNVTFQRNDAASVNSNMFSHFE